MKFTFVHTADLHGNRERADDTIHSQNVMFREAQAAEVALTIKAGDIWDHTIQNHASSRFPDLLESTRRFADIAPLFLLRGTQTHDIKGSLDVFRSLRSKFPIVVIDSPEAGVPYFVSLTDGTVQTSEQPDPSQVLVLGVPEAGKEHIMAHLDNSLEGDAAVRAALQMFFVGLGAIRRKYAHLPCILIYHGQVGGARLQTGEILEGGSGLRPSVDDLAAVGADYIAMGDQHLPQRVGESIGLPAYYSGPAYAKDHGEAFETGCNFVTLQPAPTGASWDHDVRRVPFGHPVNLTIKGRLVPSLLGPAELDVDLKKAVKPGHKVKLEIRYNKEDGAGLNQDEWIDRLLALGAVPGSFVTLDQVHTETTRAAEITQQTCLEDKAAVWFKHSGKPFVDTLRAKVRTIETETENPAAVEGQPRRFRNVSTLIRGAKGFWKKQRKDEVFLDWEAQGPGVLAYIGPNGYGKTTSFDFCKPWPVPVSRPPKTLKPHFRLRDSVIENIYLEEVSGTLYRSLITIDAGVASGKTEYFLYVAGANGWEITEKTDGRLAAYEEAIERIFGSLEIYLRTAYAAQKPTKDRPDISEATQGEKKALIAELAGKDHLSVYAAAAHERGDALSKTIENQQTEISVLESRLPDRTALEDAVADHIAAVQDTREDLEILNELGKHHRQKVDAIGVLIAANKQTSDQALAAGEASRAATRRLEENRAAVVLQRAAVEAKPAAEKTIAEHARLTELIAAENAGYQEHLQAKQRENDAVTQARNAHDEENRKVLAAYEAKRAAHDSNVRSARETHDTENRQLLAAFETQRTEHDNKVRAARDAESQASRAVDLARHQVTTAETGIAVLQRAIDAPVEDHCEVCKQLLPEEARNHVLDVREALRNDLAAAQDALRTARADVDAKVAAREDLARQLAAVEAAAPTRPSQPPFDASTLEAQAPARPELPAFVSPPSQVPPFDATTLESLKADLAFCPIDRARVALSAAETAQARIEELTKQQGDLEATAAREAQREAQLTAELRTGLDEELAAAEKPLQAVRDRYTEVQQRGAAAAAELNQARQKITDLERDIQAIAALKEALVDVLAEISEWTLVEAAIDGVRDLELDALAPLISEVASRLLASSGQPGHIEIETTRVSGSGKKARQIEDFLIFYVGADGEAQDIATNSGGEMVWVRKALYDAFGIIRSRNAGIRFMTGLLDETDGALFPEDRIAYFRMLMAAHAESGRFQTILITQSTEIAAMAQQVIDVRQLGPRQKEAVAA